LYSVFLFASSHWLTRASQDIASIDNDVKTKFNQYNSSKTSLASALRSRTGNLSQKSLSAVVNPKNLLAPDASEYLQQHLIAVPKNQVKDYLQSYESLCPMVVPRSSQELAKDDEFSLFAVTVFKKHSAEFVHKVREKRWTPREWKFTEGGREAEEREQQKLEKDERRVWGEALRLGRTGYSDAVMAWIHVLALRVFVETVLRYGLPLSFVCGLVKVSSLTIILSCTRKLTHHTDGQEAGRKGKEEPRRCLLTPWWKRIRSRQEGQSDQG
jgi:V-type H+-transporting ATPase subunit C